MLPSPYPVVGYGGLLKAPYVWPGSHENTELKGAFVKPPPIPMNLQPVLLLAPCPAGQMRRAAPPVLPGQKAPDAAVRFDSEGDCYAVRAWGEEAGSAGSGDWAGSDAGTRRARTECYCACADGDSSTVGRKVCGREEATRWGRLFCRCGCWGEA